MRNPPPVHVGIHEDLASMSRLHELTPHGVNPGVGWYNQPSLAQGMQPNNSLIPWWTGPVFAEWRAITGWWILFQSTTGHTSTNTSVEIAGQRLAVLRKSGSWEVLSQSVTPSWFSSNGEDAVTHGDPAPWSQPGLAGGTEVQPANLYEGNLQTIHGGTGRMSLWTTTQPDYDAIHMLVRCRLALRNRSGADDRPSSSLIIQVGADYYPTVNTLAQDLPPANYLPGVGVGRFLRIQNDWRTASFVCKNVGVDLLSNPPPALMV